LGGEKQEIYDSVLTLFGAYVRCSVCDEWYHGECLSQKMSEKDSETIESYHCFKVYLYLYLLQCEPIHGPTKCTTLFVYLSADKELQKKSKSSIDQMKYTRIINERTFPKAKFPSLQGQQVTVEYLAQHGFNEPVLVEYTEGLDMIMPPSDLTVHYHNL
jgi:hypothetical protein